MKKPTLNLAREYLQLGYSIISVKSKGKKPALRSWREFQKRLPTENEITSWFSRERLNVGIVAGELSGVVVLDADSAEAVKWCEANLPKTPTVQTARGRHYYFKFRSGLKNAVNVNGLELDLRGQGGFVVAPPSEHETGVLYQWVEGKGLSDLMLAELPPQLLERKGDNQTASSYVKNSDKYGQAVLASELVVLKGAPVGTRNNALNRAAFSLGSIVSGGELNKHQVEVALLSAATSIGLPESEALSTIRSGMDAGAREPRCAPEPARRKSSTSDVEPEDLNSGLKEQNLKKVNIENISKIEIPTPIYSIENLIPVGEVTLLSGHGGTGKSLLALTLAAHFAAGVSWFGLSVNGGRVVYVSLEDPGDLISYRLKKIIEAYNLPVDDVIRSLEIFDCSDDESTLCVEKFEGGVRSVTMTVFFNKIKAVSVGCGLIVIDNASDAFGADENSRRQVRRFIRELRTLARENRAGLLLLSHVDKTAARNGAQGNTYSGSTAWHNSVRSRLALTGKNEYVELAQEKLNIGQKLDRSITLGWQDGVLIPDVARVGGPDAERQEDLNKAAVLSAIKKAIADGVTVPTARTGPSNCHGTLERLPDLPRDLRGRRGRDAFYKALTGLQREGVLQVEEYTTAARHIRERFICADSVALNKTPYTPAPEPAKPAQGSALVHGVR